eukprot:SAG31_NODE_3250_length_4490_cov_3.521977_4_plen_182_part_00
MLSSLLLSLTTAPPAAAAAFTHQPPVKVIIGRAPTMVWVPNGTSGAAGALPGRLLVFSSCEDYSVCMSLSTDLGATWDTGNVTAGAATGGGEGSAKAPLHMAGLPFSGTGWHGLPGLFWGLGAAVHIPGTQRVLLQFGNLTAAKGGCDDGVLQEYGPRQVESTDAVSIARSTFAHNAASLT